MRVLWISCVLIGSITCVPPQSAYGQDLSKPKYQQQNSFFQAQHSLKRLNSFIKAKYLNYTASLWLIKRFQGFYCKTLVLVL